MMLNTFNQNTASTETTLDELEYLKSELTSDYPVSKARLNYISHQLFKMESVNKNFKLREESFTGDLQADLVVRREDMIAAGIATLIAMLIAYFSTSGPSSGGGSSAPSAEEIKKKAKVKARVDINKILRGAVATKEIKCRILSEIGWCHPPPKSFPEITLTYDFFQTSLIKLFKKLGQVFSKFENKRTIDDFLNDKNNVESPVNGNLKNIEFISNELKMVALNNAILTTLEKELPGFTKELNEDAEALKKALEEEAKANST